MTAENRPSADLLELMLAQAQIGWWRADFKSQTLCLSQTTAQLLGTDRLEYPFGEFPDAVCEIYRIRLTEKLRTMRTTGHFDETFSATINGETEWMRATTTDIQIDPETEMRTTFGSIRRLTKEDLINNAPEQIGTYYDMTMLANRQIDLLIRNLPIGYLRMNLLRNDNGTITDYVIAYVNKMAATILGIGVHEILGKTATELGLDISDQLSLISNLPIDEYFEQSWQSERNNRHCRSLTYNTPGDCNELVVLLEDVTDSVNANNLLKTRQEFLTNIFQSISVGIELYDPKGLLLDANAKDLEMFGVEDIAHIKDCSLFENPNIPDTIKAELLARKDAEYSTVYDFDQVGTYYSHTRRGKMDWTAHMRCLYDNNGDLTNYLLINIDNTELNRSRSRLADFENMFSLVSDFARVGFANLNLLTGEGYSQGIWRQNYGESESTPPAQIIGHYNHVQSDDRERLKGELGKIVSGQQRSGSAIVRVLPDNGEVRWTKANFFCRDYRPEDNVIELVSINYDITALKQTENELIAAKERAEEGSKLKSAFLANMSHEIRTPLNAIVGFSELLAWEEDSAARKDYTEIILHNNNLLLQIISDVLDLARIESGHAEIVRTKFDLRELCSETVDMLRLQCQPGVVLRTENGLSECLICEYRQGLTQVIGNFARNALKFTSEGSVTIGFGWQRGNLRVYVRDTGIGIAPEAQAQVFERFVKLDTFTQGTGLGLSICKSIAEQIGASIGVESAPGEGSCFYIDIPEKE